MTDHRVKTEALIEAIWGASASVRPRSADPETRRRQNEDLAHAIRDYLQQYLTEAGEDELIRTERR